MTKSGDQLRNTIQEPKIHIQVRNPFQECNSGDLNANPFRSPTQECNSGDPNANLNQESNHFS